MDTTAAAEVGGEVVDGGVGLWDTGGAVEAERWAAAENQQQQGWGGGEGTGRGGHDRPSASYAPNIAHPSRITRSLSGGRGGGEGYGSRSGNFNDIPALGGFRQGAPDGGLRAGYSPGSQGGSPSMKNGFPPGVPSPGYPQGPPPLPSGTPNGDQSAQGQGMGRGRGMGSIFYKTKLCSRFRNGNCPYNTNCNFAHGMEELRRPPAGWEDVAVPLEGGGVGGRGGVGGDGGGNDGGGGNGGVLGNGGGQAGGGGGRANGAPNQPPGPNQSPHPPGGGSSEMQRFHKTRPCKKYSSEMGCPYGNRCNFLHDEPNPQTPSKSPRESTVIPVPTNGVAFGSGAGPGPSPGGGGGGGPNSQRPPNWKTRLCNKWETTGNCPFGEKCHFAHSTAELQRYGGGPIDPFSTEGSQMDSKFGMNPSANNFVDGDEGLPPYVDGHPQLGNMQQSSGLLLQQLPRVNSGPGSKSLAIWKGPLDGISTIYGDWVDDDEWESSGAQLRKDSQRYGQPIPSAGQRWTDLYKETPARKEKDQQNSSPFVTFSNGSALGYAKGTQEASDMGFSEIVT